MKIRQRLTLILALAMTLLVAGCGLAKGSENADKLADGSYQVSIEMEGGTGKAYIESPCTVNVTDGAINATIVWSSKNYDYMIVDGAKYMNESEVGEPSSFTFPISQIPCDMEVIGDTTAMSTPHEIEYTLHMRLDE